MSAAVRPLVDKPEPPSSKHTSIYYKAETRLSCPKCGFILFQRVKVLEDHPILSFQSEIALSLMEWTTHKPRHLPPDLKQRSLSPLIQKRSYERLGYIIICQMKIKRHDIIARPPQPWNSAANLAPNLML